MLIRDLHQPTSLFTVWNGVVDPKYREGRVSPPSVRVVERESWTATSPVRTRLLNLMVRSGAMSINQLAREIPELTYAQIEQGVARLKSEGRVRGYKVKGYRTRYGLMNGRTEGESGQ